MATISDKISESIKEYLVLTGWITSNLEDVSLESKLGENITLQYPYFTARMQCVVGPEMAVAAGKSGVLTLIPRSLRDEDKQKIIDENNKARLKKGEIAYVTKPVFAEPDKSYEEVIKLVEKTGHSVIPLYDRFSKLHGLYIHDPDHPLSVHPKTQINQVMTPLKKDNNDKGISFLYNDNEKEIKDMLSKENRNFVPIVNEEMILQKLAFLQSYDTNNIGMAISTKDKWKEELKKWGPQVDTLTTDSSHICFDDAIEIMKRAKEMFPDKPFGIGNLIQGKHFNRFADEYAKMLNKNSSLNPNGGIYIIGGMATGSICQTGRKRGNGRGNFTVAKELADARDNYFKEKKIYIPIAIDGGISTPMEILVALALCDFVVMGNYFNRFYEAAAMKLDSDEKPTNEESNIKFVETWGEGTIKARYVAMFGLDYREVLKNPIPEDIGKVLERYGQSISTATIEGVEGTVKYRGRLKPCIEKDASYIRTTIVNTGAPNLEEYRKIAILEKASKKTLEEMEPHDIIIDQKK